MLAYVKRAIDVTQSLNRLIAPYVLRFFLPWACAGCRTALYSLDDDGFCGRCWLAIPRIQGTVCQACGIPLKEGGGLCYSCRLEPPRLVVRAAATYDGVIPPAVFRFKYAGRKSLAKPFGTLLRYAWHLYPELHDACGLVPVPLYGRRERLRGYNQAELLARQLSAEVARPVLPLLIRTRKTPEQVSLSRAMRQTNLKGAFAVHPQALARRQAFKGRSVLLIDDVSTTTSTLQECAKALFRGGIRTVGALVLARDL